MVEVKNLLFQPLSLHTRDGRGLHLGPRERLRIPDDAVSPEIEAAARRGHIATNAECGTQNSGQQAEDAERETSEEPNIPRSAFPLPHSEARSSRRRRS